ncbi:hypothetical protein [Iodobacter fluviatilis]|uniref:hypothetical protein n=1 Tax=Iodobacter fluviatilis TaxID=537 RepID=UPI00165E38A1|nr:hypothetical protein [Iodobacter fluviatilis]
MFKLKLIWLCGLFSGHTFAEAPLRIAVQERNTPKFIFYGELQRISHSYENNF